MLNIAFCGGIGYKNPWDYPNFKEYWADEKDDYKSRVYKNLIWRIIHYKNWVCRDGYIVWEDFLFYSSPIIPPMLKAYCKYKSSVKMWNTVTGSLIDDMASEINNKILQQMKFMTDEELDNIENMSEEDFDNLDKIIKKRIINNENPNNRYFN